MHAYLRRETNTGSYRGYKFPWVGQPKYPPNVYSAAFALILICALGPQSASAVALSGSEEPSGGSGVYSSGDYPAGLRVGGFGASNGNGNGEWERERVGRRENDNA